MDNPVQKFKDFYFDITENKICSESTHHYHNGFEVYYLKSGKCHYFIGNASYDVISGDIVLIPKATIHRTNYTVSASTRLLINFPEEYLCSEILSNIFTLSNLYRNENTIPQVNEIFAKIESEYNRADSLSHVALRCYTEELFLLMLRNRDNAVTVNNENSIVENTIKYIQTNYMNNVRLSEVAKLMSVSEEHLSRMFKKKTAFGFNEYLTTLRLQKAEHMLKNEPGRTIGDIAFACGFNDSNYFSFKFKKAYGVPPTSVKSHKKTNVSHKEKY